MKIASSLLALCAIGQSLTIPATTEAHSLSKRWSVSDPRPDANIGQYVSYTVTVMSGIIMKPGLYACQWSAGADWAGAFTSALLDSWSSGHLVEVTATGFYPTVDTGKLYCTTLAAQYVFNGKFALVAARMFQQHANGYMSQAVSGVVSQVEVPVDEKLIDMFDQVRNDTAMTQGEAGAVDCANKCKFAFGSDDTGICHDDWAKLSRNNVVCKKRIV